MSSISAQGVVERASAELTKRINGLRGAAKHHHHHHNAASSGGGAVKTTTSVMERVTNVFCGGGGGANNAVTAPEKPSRVHQTKGGKKRTPPPPALTWGQLLMDERFLGKFFLYFTPYERSVLAQVCSRYSAHFKLYKTL